MSEIRTMAGRDILWGTILAVLLGLSVAAPCGAQYIFLDTNGDGLSSLNPFLAPAPPPDPLDATITEIDVYCVPGENRDGSVAACADGPMVVFYSYGIALRSGGSGTVQFNSWTDRAGFPSSIITEGDHSFTTTGSDCWIGRGGGPGILLNGLSKLGTLSVTVTGTPWIAFLSSSALIPCAKTAFGTHCAGHDFDNTYKLGCPAPGDWTDSDGIGQAVAADAGLDQVACASEGTTTFTLAGNAGIGAPHWTVMGGTATATIADPSSLTSEVTVTGTGTVELELTSSSAGLCATDEDTVLLTVNPSPTCGITGDVTTCAAKTGLLYTVSSPVPGATFTWSVTGNATIQSVTPDGLQATVNAGAAGTFTLSVESAKDGCVSLCGLPVNVLSCLSNCPRTAGYWTQQVQQKGNGSSMFTVAQVTQVAECVDDQAAIFQWAGGTDFSSLKATLDPASPMDQRKQAKRQFATFLSNMCTGSLGLIASNGAEIFLDPSTPFVCAGLSSTTLGELVAAVDARMVALEGQSLTDPAVKSEYSSVLACLDAINNGIGIGTVCPEVQVVGGGGVGLARGGVDRVFTVRPAPNPFTKSTYFVLEVRGSDERVDVRVYDVAGRLVRTIARGSLGPGRWEMAWDGYGENGDRMPTGVYFLRASLGDERTVVRVLHMR
jgi:hypothetical protein